MEYWLWLESNLAKSNAHGTPPSRVQFTHQKAAVTIQTSNEFNMDHYDRGARKKRDLCIGVLLENLPHKV